jgi:peptidoglycan hydrolase CwlO-like protein
MTLAKFTIPAILTAALFAAPAFADPAEDLKEAVKKLEKATKELQEAKEALKIDDLRGKSLTIENKIDAIDKDIGEIKKDLRDLKRRLENGGSTSLKSESLYSGQGRVRFINEFSEEMSIVVNGRSFRLAPGQERLVPVPPGDFTYQVLQLERFPRERKIEANETKTVRIYPLP